MKSLLAPTTCTAPVHAILTQGARNEFKIIVYYHTIKNKCATGPEAIAFGRYPMFGTIAVDRKTRIVRVTRG